MNVSGALTMGARVGKTGFQFLAYIALLLAAVGVVLPLLPTTPFVLLAAFFASKGSPAFARWLEGHPRYGPAIENWQRNRAVPVKAKGLALGMMGLSWGTLFIIGTPVFALAMSGGLLTAAACYLLKRPS
ncbi:YbaN family protein [Marinobacter salinus]|nr:YbaN family protein [Marinobacter salinus]